MESFRDSGCRSKNIQSTPARQLGLGPLQHAGLRGTQPGNFIGIPPTRHCGAWAASSARHPQAVDVRPFISSLLVSALVACNSTPTREALPTLSPSLTQTVPAEALNPDVRQETIHQTICVSGYTASVRPSTIYTNGVKRKLMRQQSLPTTAAAYFELDHHVPLALGGHPRNLQNLMLQHWEGDGGAKKKDRLERKLQMLVCADKVMLDDARRAIWFDWQGAYRRYVSAP